jgi:hypothetical protein
MLDWFKDSYDGLDIGRGNALEASIGFPGRISRWKIESVESSIPFSLPSLFFPISLNLRGVWCCRLPAVL